MVCFSVHAYSCIVVASANVVSPSVVAADAAIYASSGVALPASAASFVRFAKVAITPAVLACCVTSACLACSSLCASASVATR